MIVLASQTFFLKEKFQKKSDFTEILTPKWAISG